jgi:hypothetical protein
MTRFERSDTGMVLLMHRLTGAATSKRHIFYLNLFILYRRMPEKPIDQKINLAPRSVGGLMTSRIGASGWAWRFAEGGVPIGRQPMA